MAYAVVYSVVVYTAHLLLQGVCTYISYRVVN